MLQLPDPQETAAQLPYPLLVRTCRQMYSQEYFSKMQSQALRMWAQLEQDTGVTLLKPHGLLFYGATDTGGWVRGLLGRAC